MNISFDVMFTCISCRVAFPDAQEQRAHFSTDWHRYNMKRRVANLPPVPALSFNEKVIERREQHAVRIDPKELACLTCSKNFSTENAYRSHIGSKKHFERERARAAHSSEKRPGYNNLTAIRTSHTPEAVDSEGAGLSADVDSDDEGISNRLATARRQIQPTDCIFCSQRSDDVAGTIKHMSSVHSFFIPERDHLIDLTGLLIYLGEKVVVGNICLHCPNGGREFGSLDAVRRHMVDKGHCKMAFETDEDLAEVSDYYDWQSRDGANSDSEWEDTDDLYGDSPGIESVRGVGLSPDGLSLILPSGRILGHRSLRVYYSQQFRHVQSTGSPDANALKVQRVRQLLADPTQALVSVAGGGGAYGRGLHVIKARNAGEAAWVKKQARSFKDQRVREEHKTRVGYVHNSQKHFRDPLLQ